MDTFRHKVSDDFSPQTLEAFMVSMDAKWEQPGSKTWSISADGELGGLVTFERMSPWLGTAHLLLKPGFQGKGVAMQACRAAVTEMFALGVGKLAFYPLASGSLAIGSLLVNLGAKREGRLIGHTLIGGKPADVILYGLSKEDFENANGNSSRSVDIVGDRRGKLGSGSGALEPQEGIDQHQHANALA